MFYLIFYPRNPTTCWEGTFGVLNVFPSNDLSGNMCFLWAEFSNKSKVEEQLSQNNQPHQLNQVNLISYPVRGSHTRSKLITTKGNSGLTTDVSTK